MCAIFLPLASSAAVIQGAPKDPGPEGSESETGKSEAPAPEGPQPPHRASPVSGAYWPRGGDFPGAGPFQAPSKGTMWEGGRHEFLEQVMLLCVGDQAFGKETSVS